MSWKRVVYVLFVAGVAVISALGGAVAGGIGVYWALNQTQRAGLAHTTPAAEANASSQSGQLQALQVNTTDISQATR